MTPSLLLQRCGKRCCDACIHCSLLLRALLIAAPPSGAFALLRHMRKTLSPLRRRPLRQHPVLQVQAQQRVLRLLSRLRVPSSRVRCSGAETPLCVRGRLSWPSVLPSFILQLSKLLLPHFLPLLAAVRMRQLRVALCSLAGGATLACSPPQHLVALPSQPLQATTVQKCVWVIAHCHPSPSHVRRSLCLTRSEPPRGLCATRQHSRHG